MAINADYEQGVAESNPELYDLIMKNQEIIPDFTAVGESSHQSRHIGDMWSVVYKELENIGSYAKLWEVLKIRGMSFGLDFDRTTMRQFVVSFPTLTWVCLLNSYRGESNGFKLILSADRLDFIDEGVSRLNLMKRNDVTSQIWPRGPTISILREIRELATAKILAQHWGVRKNYVMWSDAWLIDAVRDAPTKFKSHPGLAYYATVASNKVTLTGLINSDAPDDALIDRLQALDMKKYLSDNNNAKALEILVALASKNRPHILELLLTTISLEIPLNIPIVSAGVATIFHRTNRLVFNEEWAKITPNTMSSDAFEYLYNAGAITSQDVLQTLAVTLFNGAAYATLLSCFDTCDKSYNTTDDYLSKLIIFSHVPRSDVVAVLRNISPTIVNFEHIEKLAQHLDIGDSAHLFLDFHFEEKNTNKWRTLFVIAADLGHVNIIRRLIELQLVSSEYVDMKAQILTATLKAIRKART